MNDLICLQDLFNKKIFRIPDYQRGYSWDNIQLEEFWNDILNLMPGKEYYTGMISLKKLDEEYTKKWTAERWLTEDWGYSAYHIVDGQQRLTTFIILLNEIINYYKNTNKGKDLKEIFINSIPLNKIIEDYLVIEKPDSAGIIKSFKFGYEVDNPSYKYFKCKILEAETPGVIEETFYTLNLENAKKFFKERIKELVEKSEEKELENLFKKLTQKMMFNIYYIKDDFNVFIAFETMNNRGKKLSNLELLKNRLIYLTTIFNLSDAVQDIIRKDINETWKTVYACLGKNKLKPLNDDEFLQAHWIIYFGYSRSNKTTYNSFLLKDFFTQKNIKRKGNSVLDLVNEKVEFENTESTIIEELEDEQVTDVATKKQKLTIEILNDYIKSMKNLISYWYDLHNQNLGMNDDIRKMLERLNRLGFVYFKPLITVILSKNDIEDSTKAHCLKLIERFIFLHFRFAGYFSTYKNSYFYNLAHLLYINEVSIEKVIEELEDIDFLSDNKVANMTPLFNQVERWFKNYKGYYSWATLRYVLYEYERKLMADKAAVKILPENIFKKDEKDHYSIEHIYPQNPDNKEWGKYYSRFSEKNRKRLNGSLGNLLPLSMSINSSLQNSSFEEKKKKRYKQGSYNEIEVSQYKYWTSNEILDRGIKLLKFIELEWDFIVPNKADRIKLLGLEFMIKPEDENKDVTIPVNLEKSSSSNDKFTEEDFLRLSEKSNEFVTNTYKIIDEFCMSLGNEIKKNATLYYISYKSKNVFLEFHFRSNFVQLYLRPGKYKDSLDKVKKLKKTYQWTNNNSLKIYEDDDLEYVKDIIRQSYEK